MHTVIIYNIYKFKLSNFVCFSISTKYVFCLVNEWKSNRFGVQDPNRFVFIICSYD